MSDVNTIIANRALTKLGDSRLTDFSDDTKAGRAIRAVYDGLLDATLRGEAWTCAIRRAELHASASAPAFGYERAFPLPAGFLRLVQIVDLPNGPDLIDYRGPGAPAWVVEGSMLLTNMIAPLRIRYVQRIQSGLDPLFVEAFAWRLASEVAEELTQSDTKRVRAEQGYAEALRVARRLHAIERSPEMLADGSWITGRL